MNSTQPTNDWSALARKQWEYLQAKADPRVWISVASTENFAAQIAALEQRRTANEPLPLLGQTFAVKDNIDALGFSTTAGCPDYSFSPKEDAVVVGRLKAAGAIVLGKTTLDQFATGLVGTRSPHGPCPNSFNSEFISGGSSSGSAVAVARGEADFALGTDTAGSGRVPAALNGLIGYKPTIGILSARGVVPACRSLDCVSIFAKTSAQAGRIAAVVRWCDDKDAYARTCQPRNTGGANGAFRFGIPPENQLQFFGDAQAPGLFAEAVAKLISIGGEPVVIDYSRFAETASLLYQGPWVAERYAAVGEWIEAHPDSCDQTVAKIILSGKTKTATETFRAMYQLKALQRAVAAAWSQCACLVVPTAGALYRIAEVLANPVELNSRLGYYNNFVNLLDLAAVTVPTGFWPSGVSFGINLCGPAFSDDLLLTLAGRILGEPPSAPASNDTIRLAVVGAHLRGQPLNHQLASLNAEFLVQTRTAPRYRLHALVGTVPPKPGLARVAEGGSSVELEIFALSPDAFGRFVATVPPPLCIGSVELEDGTWVKGFLCEPVGLQGASDISRFGGWRAYLAAGRA